MNVFSCDDLIVNLPAKHRFPMRKYSLLRKAVTNLTDVEIKRAWRPDRIALEKVHSKIYVGKVFEGELSRKEIERVGFPWSNALVERSLYSVGSTIAAAFDAMQNGISCSLAGGTHHAGRDFGEGFCVFNDIAVAVSLLRDHYPNIRILIVDTDVHQGNGTADLLKSLDRVFTLSLHSARNYPHEKKHSNIDVSFPDNTEDYDYLAMFSDALEQAVECSNPDFVFFLAGADIYKGDRLGRLDISKEGIRARDRLFFSTFNSLKIKIAVVMGGGYAPCLGDIVDIHLSTVHTAATALRKRH